MEKNLDALHRQPPSSKALRRPSYGGQALARELKLKTSDKQMLAALEKAGLI
jgi:hypothetical protein